MNTQRKLNGACAGCIGVDCCQVRASPVLEPIVFRGCLPLDEHVAVQTHHGHSFGIELANANRLAIQK